MDCREDYGRQVAGVLLFQTFIQWVSGKLHYLSYGWRCALPDHSSALIHTPEAGVDQQSQCCEQVACTQDEQAGDEMYPFDEIATPNEWVYAAAFLLYCTGFLPQAVRRNHIAWKSSCNISMSMSRYNWSSSS